MGLFGQKVLLVPLVSSRHNECLGLNLILEFELSVAAEETVLNLAGGKACSCMCLTEGL